MKMLENVLKGNKNCFELVGGLSYRGFKLPGVDCMYFIFIIYDSIVIPVWLKTFMDTLS